MTAPTTSRIAPSFGLKMDQAWQGDPGSAAVAWVRLASSGAHVGKVSAGTEFAQGGSSVKTATVKVTR